MHLNSQSSYFLEKNYLNILESCYMRLPERLKALMSLTEYCVSLIGKKKNQFPSVLCPTVIPNKEPQITEIIAR